MSGRLEAERRAALTADDPRHGTPNGYNNYKCRCQRCRDAWAAYYAEVKTRFDHLLPGDERHGTYNGYTSYRCRCRSCKDAANAYKRGYNRRRRAEAAVA